MVEYGMFSIFERVLITNPQCIVDPGGAVTLSVGMVGDESGRRKFEMRLLGFDYELECFSYLSGDKRLFHHRVGF